MHRWITSSRCLALLGCIILLTSCGTPTATPVTEEETPTPAVHETATPAPPSPTPTQAQPEFISICTGQEPTSLFIYADTSPGAAAVYQAIYDGPIDQRAYQDVPVILENLPDETNGGIAFAPVEVQAGDLIIDANGDWQTLAAGVQYLPSGCRTADCAAAYAGTEAVSIDQMVIRFTLKAGIHWSDGNALSAEDSVYSFQVARGLYPAYRADLISVTQSYLAIDPVTVEWRGVPGFQGGQPNTYFFHPLPAHKLGLYAAQDLYTTEAASKLPLGWGPYTIHEWTAGDHITLKRNPLYFRAAEGLPAFENLVIRFVDSSRAGVNALLAGECDFIDETVHIEELAAEVSPMVDEGKAVLFTSPETGWEQLSFGILPADPERPAPFASVEVRRAAAYCIDRQALADVTPGAQVMDTYVMPGDPAFNAQAGSYALDLQQAAQLLDAAGWTDVDGDPATPRMNPGGATLAVIYLVPDDPARAAGAEFIASSLESCGFKVDLQTLAWEEIMAAGPDGPVFGRSFDLAQFGWAVSSGPACSLYLSTEVPGPFESFAKGWGGANASGYMNPEYDTACRASLLHLPDSAAHLTAQSLAQEIFAAELPALPLYSYSGYALARPDLCGVEPSAGTPLLWNLEAINYGPGCPPAP